jgi:hypothetical protein
MQSKHVLLGDGWITSLGHENQALPAQEVQAPYRFILTVTDRNPSPAKEYTTALI